MVTFGRRRVFQHSLETGLHGHFIQYYLHASDDGGIHSSRRLSRNEAYSDQRWDRRSFQRMERREGVYPRKLLSLLRSLVHLCGTNDQNPHQSNLIFDERDDMCYQYGY